MHNDVGYNHLDVIVTTTYFCNMNCVYCYNNRSVHEREKTISVDTVRKIFEITIPYYKYVHFLWHGGEPLSLGKEFYEKIIAMQKEINTYGTEVTNSIQSNLTLLDEDMARFAIDNNIKLGSSFDGITNERTRHCSERILAGHEVLKAAGGHNGFICVVQSENIDHLVEDYEWFKQHKAGYNHNMYIASYPYEQDPLFIKPEHFADKMCELFDVWLYDKECNIGVGYFEILLNYILLKRKSVCCYNDCIGKHIGIRYDGSIYGCNRDMPEEFSYGNVYDYTDIHESFDSEGFNNYLRQAITRRNKCMNECEIYDFCHGGCNNVALQKGNVEKPNEPSCKALKLVYSYVEQRIEALKGKDIEELTCILNPRVLDLLRKLENMEC